MDFATWGSPGTGRLFNHNLHDWFGHSGAIAEMHPLQTTESDFENSDGGNAGGNSDANPAEYSASRDCGKIN
ncbi:hypothetical protein [Stieleria tagensis]|uniref:hypothetical protein n=1 Tax=Stieleria tagensis TaxID=2956795 RepID=UPI00209B1202|nr:hypothetical protein [Stieleria tagensis]